MRGKRRKALRRCPDMSRKRDGIVVSALFFLPINVPIVALSRRAAGAVEKHKSEICPEVNASFLPRKE